MSSSYPYKYFSGANITIQIGKKELDCAGLSFVLNESQQPAYGYASTHYDMILAGRVLVQGSFVLNFSEENAFYDLIKSESLELNDPNVFDIHIKYNNMNKNKKDLIIKDCFLISRGQSIQISDQAILEEYSFIGRELVSESFNSKLEKIANDAKAAAAEARRRAKREAEERSRIEEEKTAEEQVEEERKAKEEEIKEVEQKKEPVKKANEKVVEYDLLLSMDNNISGIFEEDIPTEQEDNGMGAFYAVGQNIETLMSKSAYLTKHEDLRKKYNAYVSKKRSETSLYLYNEGYEEILNTIFSYIEEAVDIPENPEKNLEEIKSSIINLLNTIKADIENSVRSDGYALEAILKNDKNEWVKEIK